MTTDTRKIRFGLIGYGSWAERVHIPSLALAESAELVALCGPDVERARRMADQYHIPFATSNALALIQHPDVDVVLIASPNHVHAEAAIAAARTGKHILCEKPLARTLDEARAMTAAVNAAGVDHMVAFTWRHVPAAQLAQRLVAEGELGRVLHVEAHFLHHGWLSLDTKRTWRFDRKRMGSGILGDLGVHLFDMLAWMVGTPITRMCARLSTFGPKPDIAGQPPVFDDAHMLLEFASGARGSVRLSRVTTSAYRAPFPDMHQGVELYGERGALIYDLHRHSQLELRRVKQPAALIDAPNPLPTSDNEWVVMHEMGRRQIERFTYAIRTGQSVQPSFADGLHAQAVMQAAEQSQDTDTWAEVEKLSA